MVIAVSDGSIYESDTHMAIDIPLQVKPDIGIPQATKFPDMEDQVHTNPNYYDEAGFQASGQAIADNGHRPDTFKLPQHITFSTDSKYHGVDGNEGGQWRKVDTSDEGQDRWSFTPGATNFKYHSLQEMKQYFQKYEPGNVLNAVAGDVVPLPISPDTEIKARIGQMNRAANDNNKIQPRPKAPSPGISGDEYWKGNKLKFEDEHNLEPNIDLTLIMGKNADLDKLDTLSANIDDRRNETDAEARKKDYSRSLRKLADDDYIQRIKSKLAKDAGRNDIK